MNTSTEKQQEFRRASLRTCFLLALLVGVPYLVISHKWTMSKDQQVTAETQFHRQENVYAKRQKTTTKSSAVGFFFLGGVGALCLLRQPVSRCSWNHPLFWTCGLFVSWCLLSMFWSPAFGVSMRKTAILILYLTCAFGISRLIRLEDLCWVVVAVCTSFVVIGFLAEIANGTFQPWKSSYRFAGTLHPNSQALQCSFLCIAAGFLNWKSIDRPWLRRLLFAFGFLALLLTKSRTSLLALLVVGFFSLLMRARGSSRALVASLLVSLACLVTLAYEFVPRAASDSTASAATMGRGKDVNSLTGRLPLWDTLWDAADDHLLIGHGFGGFWSDKNILKYSKKFAWQIPHAHNAYLDLILAVGMVGFALYLLTILYAFGLAIVRYGQSHRSGELFAACVILYSMIHCLAESAFPFGGICSTFLFVVIARLATKPEFAGARDNAFFVTRPPTDPLPRPNNPGTVVA